MKHFNKIKFFFLVSIILCFGFSAHADEWLNPEGKIGGRPAYAQLYLTSAGRVTGYYHYYSNQTGNPTSPKYQVSGTWRAVNTTGEYVVNLKSKDGATWSARYESRTGCFKGTLKESNGRSQRIDMVDEGI